MKFFHAVVITGLLSSIILGQNIKAPDTLISSETAQATAKSLGVEVFKILPRGLYKDPPSASKDEDNPIGIREGGASPFFFHNYQSCSFWLVTGPRI